jgi:hypothetical protein
MSKSENNIRPLGFTPPNLEAIKAQFAAEQKSDSPPVQESIILGQDGRPAATSGNPEVPAVPAEEPAPNVRFHAFPKSGNIFAALEHPETPGTIALCVNIEPDDTREPRPLCVAITRIADVAHMICAGVNYMFKAQQILNAENAAKSKVDTNPSAE